MGTPTKGILDSLAETINGCVFDDESCKGFHYRQKQSCSALCGSPPRKINGRRLVGDMYARIERNLLERAVRSAPSAKNWTLRSLSEDASTENKSEEVLLERAIVRKWPATWRYQAPVASGLFGPAVDKRRAVDLIYLRGQGNFDFVELKVSNKAGSPLYAAMEILGYGLIYLAARREVGGSRNRSPSGPHVLDARNIRLCVLAPRPYYLGSDTSQLQLAINEGLTDIVSPESDRFAMSFRFERFSDDYRWSKESRRLKWDGKRHAV